MFLKVMGFVANSEIQSFIDQWTHHLTLQDCVNIHCFLEKAYIYQF